MTIASTFWRRRFPHLNLRTRREFEVEPGTRIAAECDWQPVPRQRPTLVMIHGLEGSCESGYMLGTAEHAFLHGFNVVRLNQRNCGGTDALTPTLYNSSLSGDVRAVIEELIGKDQLPEIFAAGFSMGGNLVLKMAGEFAGNAPRELRAVAGICPAIDVAACVDALEEPRNFIYQTYFVRKLKARYHLKLCLFPNRYKPGRYKFVRTVREYDDAVTAPYCGFRDSSDYYLRASAQRVIHQIQLPALLLTSRDDTIIPFRSFAQPAIAENRHLTLDAPEFGGHCAFITRNPRARFWAESRVVEFFHGHSSLPTS